MTRILNYTMTGLTSFDYDLEMDNQTQGESCLAKYTKATIGAIIRWLIMYDIIKPNGTTRRVVALSLLGLTFRGFLILGTIGTAQIICGWMFPDRSTNQYITKQYLSMGVIIMFQQCLEWLISEITYNRMDRLEDRMDSLEKRMDRLEERMDRFEENTNKRFEALFQHLGIPDPCNRPSAAALAEYQRNFNSYQQKRIKVE